MNSSPEFTRTRTLLEVNELIHKHYDHYGQELIVKLEDLKRALDTNSEPAIDVLRHQVQTLEARLETLQRLEDDLQGLGKEKQS